MKWVLPISFNSILIFQDGYSIQREASIEVYSRFKEILIEADLAFIKPPTFAIG